MTANLSSFCGIFLRRTREFNCQYTFLIPQGRTNLAALTLRFAKNEIAKFSVGLPSWIKKPVAIWTLLHENIILYHVDTPKS